MAFGIFAQASPELTELKQTPLGKQTRFQIVYRDDDPFLFSMNSELNGFKVFDANLKPVNEVGFVNACRYPCITFVTPRNFVLGTVEKNTVVCDVYDLFSQKSVLRKPLFKVDGAYTNLKYDRAGKYTIVYNHGATSLLNHTELICLDENMNAVGKIDLNDVPAWDVKGENKFHKVEVDSLGNILASTQKGTFFYQLSTQKIFPVPLLVDTYNIESELSPGQNYLSVRSGNRFALVPLEGLQKPVSFTLDINKALGDKYKWNIRGIDDQGNLLIAYILLESLKKPKSGQTLVPDFGYAKIGADQRLKKEPVSISIDSDLAQIFRYSTLEYIVRPGLNKGRRGFRWGLYDVLEGENRVENGMGEKQTVNGKQYGIEYEKYQPYLVQYDSDNKPSGKTALKPQTGSCHYLGNYLIFADYYGNGYLIRLP